MMLSETELLLFALGNILYFAMSENYCCNAAPSIIVGRKQLSNIDLLQDDCF